MAEHDPYVFAATGVVGGRPGAFGAPAQPPMHQQQTGAPLAYPTLPPQQLQHAPVEPYDQPYNGGVFGRQGPPGEAYTMQALGHPLDGPPRRPGSAGTGHDTLPGIAGVGSAGGGSGSGGADPGAGPPNQGFASLAAAAGLAGAAAAYRNQRECIQQAYGGVYLTRWSPDDDSYGPDPYGGYASSPVGESRYPQPRWSQQQVPQPISQPSPPEQHQQPPYQQQPQQQQQAAWYERYIQPQPQPQPQQPPTATASTSAPSYSPPSGAGAGTGALTAQGYPNEKSTYSRAAPSPPVATTERPMSSTYDRPTSSMYDDRPASSMYEPPHHPPADEDDAGSVLEPREGARVLKVTNE
jgi:hypothetical protein